MTRIIDNNIEMTRGDTAAIQITLQDDDITALFTGL